MKKQPWILPIVLSLFVSSSAQALEVIGVGGLNFHSPSVDKSGTSSDSGTGLAAGVYLGWDLFPGFGMETGAIIARRKMTLNVSGAEQKVHYGSIEVPLMLRFTALPVLSVGGGLYHARNNRKTNSGADDAGRKKGEFGTRLNARFTLPLLPLFGFVIEANYLLGLTDIDLDPNSSIKTREIQGMVGVSVGF